MACDFCFHLITFVHPGGVRGAARRGAARRGGNVLLEGGEKRLVSNVGGCVEVGESAPRDSVIFTDWNR